MTFVNDHGGRFTALRTYYVPRRATRSGDVRCSSRPTRARSRSTPSSWPCPSGSTPTPSRSCSPGIRVHRTYAEYSAVLHARLGIGANGDGAKALRLLARIQAGNQVRSVDELYKDMVLERPATYAAADRAIEHFDDLDTAYSAMRTEEQKLELLEPDHRPARAPARGRPSARRARLLRRHPGGATPRCGCGCCAPMRGCSRTAVAANRDARTATADDLAATTSAEAALLGDLEAAKEAHRAAGGSTLQSLGLSLEQEAVVREDRLGRRAVLQERMLPLIDLTRRPRRRRRGRAALRRRLRGSPAAHPPLARRAAGRARRG